MLVNDLATYVKNIISKFTDDMKIGGIVDSEDNHRLQDDINQLGQSNSKWDVIVISAG